MYWMGVHIPKGKEQLLGVVAVKKVIQCGRQTYVGSCMAGVPTVKNPPLRCGLS